jgi:hypothetical protein
MSYGSDGIDEVVFVDEDHIDVNLGDEVSAMKTRACR